MDFYLHEPAIMHDNTPMNETFLKNFLGGEGAMWVRTHVRVYI
jgi:hypothetical protein